MATKFHNLDTDNTLGGSSPSDYRIPSQKAIKEYIDNSSATSGLSYTAECPDLTPTEGIVSWNITHNLGSAAIQVSLYASENEIIKNVAINSSNDITVSFPSTSTIEAGSLMVVILASGGNPVNFNREDYPWVKKYLSVYSNKAFNTGNQNIDVSSFLPEEGTQYEVIMMIAQRSGNLMVSSDIMTEVGGCWNTTPTRQSIVIPVGAERKITMRVDESTKETYVSLSGYKRVN